MGGGFGLGAHLPACVGRSAQGSGSHDDPGCPDDTLPTPRAPGRRHRPPGVAAGLPQLRHHSPVARGVPDPDLACSLPCQDEARHRQACFGASPRIGSRLLERRGRVSRRHDRSPISDGKSGNAECITRVPRGRAGAEAENRRVHRAPPVFERVRIGEIVTSAGRGTVAASSPAARGSDGAAREPVIEALTVFANGLRWSGLRRDRDPATSTPSRPGRFKSQRANGQAGPSLVAFESPVRSGGKGGIEMRSETSTAAADLGSVIGAPEAPARAARAGLSTRHLGRGRGTRA